MADKREEQYLPSMPTVRAEPKSELPPEIDCCGNCPGWKRAHPRAPFGQCLPAMRFVHAPMFTPDLSGCSLDPETRAKGPNQ
jgi:hypothetical protein